MRLYEFEGKQLFAEAKIPIPEGKIVTTVDEAVEAANKLGYPVVLKSQVLTGGRGKAGGIQFADDEKQLRQKAEALFKMKIKGYPVEKILVEKKLNIASEYYLGVTIDRVNYQWTVIGCAEGGVDIEEVAAKTPEKIIRVNIDPSDKMYGYQGNELGNRMGLRGDDMKAVGGIARKLFNVFCKYDCKMVEINPLVKLTDGSFIAADSRFSLDDDARGRDDAPRTTGARMGHTIPRYGWQHRHVPRRSRFRDYGQRLHLPLRWQTR